MSEELSLELSHPRWLRSALANPKRIWNTWSLLLEREKLRAAARTRSREALGAQGPDENPFSIWNATALDENMKKHRFDIMAYDRNRVIIDGNPQRYVNASYVREGAGGRWWIAAEAPMNIATHAFLSLFLPPEDREPHTPRIHTIIQLSPAGEGSSHPPVEYYPSTLSHSWVIDPEREAPDLPRLRVQSVKQKRIPKANCTKTTFVITRPSRRSGMRENEDFEVVHLLFESWPAKSVPNSDGQRALRELMNVAYSVNTRPQYPNDGQLRGSGRALDPPILVHCAEGGRTGTFIALNSLLRSFKCIPSPYDDTHSPPKIPPSPLSPPPTGIALDPVLKEFDHLMDQRAHMVDNETQVRFVYQMLSEAISRRVHNRDPTFVPLPPALPPPPLPFGNKGWESKSYGPRKAKSSIRALLSTFMGR